MNLNSLGLLILSSFSIFIPSNGAGSIAKREASSGDLYVYSSISGCSTVKSQTPCPVNWLLPDFFARMYKGNNKVIETKLKIIFDGGDHVNKNCTEAARKALCSQVSPKCLPKSAGIEFMETNSVCKNVRRFCPEYVATEVCEDLLIGVKTGTKCVYPKKPITGACAQPKHKMPSTIFHSYKKVSIEFKDLFTNLAKLPSDHKLFSQECLTNIKEIFCLNLVCSADEKRVLIKHDLEDCNEVVEQCFDKTRKFLFSPLNVIVNNMKNLLTAQCEIYPQRNETKREHSPPVMKQSSSAAIIRTFPNLFVTLFLFCVILAG